jgi:hypothetical protein
MVCGLFLIFALIFLVYLALPVGLFRLSASWFGTSPIFRWIAPPVAGLVMGLYCHLGFSLAPRFLSFDENLLSYSYPGDPLRTGIPIAGVIGGVLLQISARLETRIERVIFTCGVLILVFIAAITGVLVMAPE